MRGYFAIGVEGISKAMNVGNLLRTSHAFGASFFFTIGATAQARGAAVDLPPEARPRDWRTEMRKSDTASSGQHLPFYEFETPRELLLPRDCRLVGVELLETAHELPSFRHPPRAAYVMGPERGELSEELLARCDFTVKIPMKFCINVGVAGAILMYDRLTSLGRFPARPRPPWWTGRTARPTCAGRPRAANARGWAIKQRVTVRGDMPDGGVRRVSWKPERRGYWFRETHP